MDQGLINPQKTIFLTKDSQGQDPIELTPTFYGNEYTDTGAYLKFNNAIKRMSEPREVEQNETDVEFVVRNEEGSIYAVVYHYEDGSVQSDMLTKTKSGGWWFYRYNTKFHPNFVSAYVSSIWGYKKPSELEIAQVLAEMPVFSGKMVFAGNYVMTVFPGGFVISRYTIGKDEEISSIESIDFVPYESLDRDSIKDFYKNDVLPFCVSRQNSPDNHFTEDLILKVLESSLARLRKKYGNKGKFVLDKETKVRFPQKV